MTASATAFTALKIAGAAHLVWLGVRALLEAWRGSPAPPERVTGSGRRGIGSAFRQGVLSNLLNPKVALVYTTLIPQFVEPGDSALARTVLLPAIFIAMGLVWLTSYALLVAHVGKLLRRPIVRRLVNAVVGTMLTALDVRLAVERR